MQCPEGQRPQGPRYLLPRGLGHRYLGCVPCILPEGWGTWILEDLGTRVQGYKSTSARGYEGTKQGTCLDTQIHGYIKVWVRGYSAGCECKVRSYVSYLAATQRTGLGYVPHPSLILSPPFGIRCRPKQHRHETAPFGCGERRRRAQEGKTTGLGATAFANGGPF